MHLEPVWHPAADRFGVSRSHTAGLQYSALWGRPLTVTLESNDRSLKIRNSLRPKAFEAFLPFALTWDRQLGTAAPTRAIAVANPYIS
jgi:hypothetical protein